MKERIDAIMDRLTKSTRAAMLAFLCASIPVMAGEWVQEPAPTTSAAAWQVIDKHLAELDTQIRAGKIGNLGSPAYGIANAFKALAGLTTTLSADQRATVQGDVQVVGREVSRLDKAGEHNDPAGVQSHLQVLKETLAKDRAYYH